MCPTPWDVPWTLPLLTPEYEFEMIMFKIKVDFVLFVCVLPVA